MLREFRLFEDNDIQTDEDILRVAEGVCDLFTDDCILDDTTSPQITRGRAALREYMIELLGGLPDFRVVPTEIWEDGNTAIMSLRLTGTHRGPFFGYAATGRPIAWSAVAVYRCYDELTKVHHETWASDSGVIGRQITGDAEGAAA
jgi:predicted ester cyclase